MPKKCLVTKLSVDATEMSDAMIAAYKTFMAGAFDKGGFAKVEFEIIEEREVNPFDRFLQSIRSEFAVLDQAATKPDSEDTDEQH